MDIDKENEKMSDQLIQHFHDWFWSNEVQGNIYKACEILGCERSEIKNIEDLIKKFAEKHY